jgi:hypothetical protein
MPRTRVRELVTSSASRPVLRSRQLQHPKPNCRPASVRPHRATPEAEPIAQPRTAREDRPLRYSRAHHRPDCQRDRARRGRVSPALAPFHRQYHAARQYCVEKVYRGVNVLALWATVDEKGFSAGVWGSYRQWAEAGAQVRSSPSSWPCRAMENRLKMHHQPTVLASPKSHRGFWG